LAFPSGIDFGRDTSYMDILQRWLSLVHASLKNKACLFEMGLQQLSQTKIKLI
jgi:hypothetical protein